MFKRFREKYSYSIRKVSKISHNLLQNYLENLRNYLYDVIKDMIEKETYVNTHRLANLDETPLVLEPISGTTLEKIGADNVKIRTFGKTKERISFILHIFANGKKAPPILVFKGEAESTLEKKLPEVKNKQVYVVCQHNSLVDSNTFVKWLQLIWFRTYLFRKVEDSLFYFDRATSHLSDEIKDSFNQNKCFFRLIPPGLTSYCQPLDISINKPFKDLIKQKYRVFCISYQNTKKPIPEYLIKWVVEVWWSVKFQKLLLKVPLKKQV